MVTCSDTSLPVAINVQNLMKSSYIDNKNFNFNEETLAAELAGISVEEISS